EAIAAATEALQLDPNCAPALRQRAQARLNKGEIDQALRDCDAALGSDPAFVRSYLLRASAHDRQGGRGRAESDRAAALRLLQPRTSSDFVERALAHEGNKEHDKALADLNRAVELDDRLVEAYNVRGNVQVARKKHRTAVADYTRALERSP